MNNESNITLNGIYFFYYSNNTNAYITRRNRYFILHYKKLYKKIVGTNLLLKMEYKNNRLTTQR
jgi:hypothetical protein